MRHTKVLSLLGLAALLFAGCKKSKDDDNNNASNVPAVDARGNITLGSDAEGACYSIKTRLYDNNSSATYDEFQNATAWFGTPTSFRPAGTVKVNNFELMDMGGFGYYNYVGFDVLFPTNTSAWSIQGSSASGVPGFTHSDNSAFPAGGNFTLPASVNINTPLTINFTPVGGNDILGVVYTLQGNISNQRKAVAGGASSVTFSPDELRTVARAQDAIAVHIMPISYNVQTLNGKKIYFVKQIQHSRETVTQ